jgi:integrase
MRELPTWWMKYHVNGRPVRESTRTMKVTVARRVLRDREGCVERGVPINPKQNRVTFEEAAENMLNDYRANGKRSVGEVERRIRLHLGPVFNRRRLAGITTDQLRAFVGARQEAGAANSEINRELSTLRRMFSLAYQDGQLTHRPHFPMLRENNVRTGFFEHEQYQSVMNELPVDLRPIVTFAYITGWRIQSELLTLQWRQVDMKACVVRLDSGSTKNGQGRVLPFGGLPELRAVLQEQERARRELALRGVICPWVFQRGGKAIKSIRGAFKNACERAGCPGRIPHDLRRTAVRNLERADVPRSVAMQITGHKTESVYRRYDIVDEADIVDGLGRLGRHGHTLGHTPTKKASSGRRPKRASS